MIGYTMVGTSDLKRSLRFYDPIFKEMRLDQCWRDGQSASSGRRDDEAYPRFFTGYPFNGKQAGVGNGSMTAFLINDTRLIDRLYDLALRNGGSDEGNLVTALNTVNDSTERMSAILTATSWPSFAIARSRNPRKRETVSGTKRQFSPTPEVLVRAVR